MQNKTIYIVIIILLVSGGFLFLQRTPETKIVEPSIKMLPDEVIEPEVVTQKMEANFSVPEGWYINHTGDYIFITKHEILPEIGNTEGYAYGDFVSISIDTLGDNTPEGWILKQYPTEDPIFHGKQWTTFNNYKLFEVKGGMMDEQIVRYIFIEDKIFVFSLYVLSPENLAVLQSIMESYFF